VIVTDGGLDNIRRLASAEPNTVAFAPSTLGRLTDDGVDVSDLVALGSVGLEPIWLFYRTALDLRGAPDLAGLEVATEGPGTVSDSVARSLVEDYGIEDRVDLRPMDSEAIEEAIGNEDVDAAFVTGASGVPLVHGLLHSDNVSFLSFRRAETYAALIPGIITLTVPEGGFDLRRGNPPQDAYLLSAATTLVATDRLPPGVAPMALAVASDVYDDKTVFSSKPEFPSKRHVGLPLDRSAKRYFEQGATGLSKFLPYKAARWLNHLGFVVLPFLGLAVVLVKVVPTVLRLWGQMRLIGLFKKLEVVEQADAAGADRSRLLDELNQIDRASAKIFVPRSQIHDYIDFRQFLHDMRERVERESG